MVADKFSIDTNSNEDLKDVKSNFESDLQNTNHPSISFKSPAVSSPLSSQSISRKGDRISQKNFANATNFNSFNGTLQQKIKKDKFTGIRSSQQKSSLIQAMEILEESQ